MSRSYIFTILFIGSSMSMIFAGLHYLSSPIKIDGAYQQSHTQQSFVPKDTVTTSELNYSKLTTEAPVSTADTKSEKPYHQTETEELLTAEEKYIQKIDQVSAILKIEDSEQLDQLSNEEILNELRALTNFSVPANLYNRIEAAKYLNKHSNGIATEDLARMITEAAASEYDYKKEAVLELALSSPKHQDLYVDLSPFMQVATSKIAHLAYSLDEALINPHPNTLLAR